MLSSEKIFVVKQYPLRYRDGDEIAKKPRDICDCGHMETTHTDENGCYDCFCPEYKYQQTLTLSQAIDLEQHINRNARKVGFTQ